MPSTLTVAREFLECALTQARSRSDVHLIGERICEVMEMQELEECRQLRAAHRGEEVLMHRVSAKRPCQFCGRPSPPRPKHDGMYICQTHQVLKEQWKRELQAERDRAEGDVVASEFRARQAARRQESA